MSCDAPQEIPFQVQMQTVFPKNRMPQVNQKRVDNQVPFQEYNHQVLEENSRKFI